MIERQKATVGLAKGGNPTGSNQHKKRNRVSEKPSSSVTLAEAGIDKNLANRVRKLKALPRDQAIYEELHPDTKHGAVGRNHPKRQSRQSGDSEPDRFTRATAKASALTFPLRTLRRVGLAVPVENSNGANVPMENGRAEP